MDGDLPFFRLLHSQPVGNENDGIALGKPGNLRYLHSLACSIDLVARIIFYLVSVRNKANHLIRRPAGDGDGVLVALHHCEARLLVANQIIVIFVVPVLHRIGDGSRSQEKLYVVSQAIGKIKAVLILLLRIARISPVVQISDILFKVHILATRLTVDLDGKLRLFIAGSEIEIELVATSGRLEIHMVYASCCIFLSATVPAHNISYAGQFLDNDLVSVIQLKIGLADVEVGVDVGDHDGIMIRIIIRRQRVSIILMCQRYPNRLAAGEGGLHISALSGV